MKVRIIKNFWVLPKQYIAITLYPFVCFSTAYIPIRKLRHEMQHVRQVRRMGFLKFYIVYLCQYLKQLVIHKNHDAAYWNIPLEIEARKNEQKSFTRAEVAELVDQVDVNVRTY